MGLRFGQCLENEQYHEKLEPRNAPHGMNEKRILLNRALYFDGLLTRFADEPVDLAPVFELVDVTAMWTTHLQKSGSPIRSGLDVLC